MTGPCDTLVVSPRLENDQCLPLIARGQAGDTAAYDRLIRLAMPHFRRVLTSCFRLKADEADECGPLILWEAARRYDPSKGATYLSYACQWIRIVVREYNRIHGGPVTVPYGVGLALRQHERGVLSHVSTPVRELMDQGPPSYVADSVDEQPGANTADMMTRYHELADLVDQAAESISDAKRRRAVCQSFTGVQYVDIGRQLGLSRERVRQLATRVIDRVAQNLERAESVS